MENNSYLKIITKPECKLNGKSMHYKENDNDCESQNINWNWK